MRGRCYGRMSLDFEKKLEINSNKETYTCMCDFVLMIVTENMWKHVAMS